MALRGRPPSGLPCVLAPGDVLGDTGDPVDLPVVIFHRKSTITDPSHGPVGSHDAVFNFESLFPPSFNDADHRVAVLIENRLHERPWPMTQAPEPSSPYVYVSGTYVKHLVQGGSGHPKRLPDVFG